MTKQRLLVTKQRYLALKQRLLATIQRVLVFKQRKGLCWVLKFALKTYIFAAATAWKFLTPKI